MGAALAMWFFVGYQATLDRFLALPCYGADGKGRARACSVEKGSFNRAMMDARECGGQWAEDDRDGAPFYYAVCPASF